MLSQLFAMRGYGRVQGDRQLGQIWREVAGPTLAAGTKPLALRNGVLNIAVSNSALLAELSSYHKPLLLAELQARHPEFKLRDLKFKLRSRQIE